MFTRTCLPSDLPLDLAVLFRFAQLSPKLVMNYTRALGLRVSAYPLQFFKFFFQ